MDGAARTTRRWGGVALVVGVLSVAIAIAAWMLSPSLPSKVRIATGQKGGTFLPLGETLAAGFAQDIPGVSFAALESAGGIASIEMLERGEVELALLSNHVRGAGAIQLVAPLYQETLHVVARRTAGIAGPSDLEGKRVGVGPEGSGTESIAVSVLDHFGLKAETMQRKNLALGDAVSALEDGTLDAAFIVGGMRTPAVDGLLARGDMHLVSLGDPDKAGSALEGIRLDAPYLSATAIPERAYGDEPPAPVGTIAVHALLVARADLDEDLVYAITESLFSHRLDLSSHDRLLAQLSERFDPAVSPYAVHPGADRFLRREEPTFVQRYNGEIGLALTVGAILWSGIAGLRAWRQNAQKNRIEVHYEAAHAVSARARTGSSAAERAEARAALEDIRDRALAELASEQLQADEGYAILQQYLTARIAELHRATPGDPADDRCDAS
jgi:TRAP transporter TAXI family solute receptor